MTFFWPERSSERALRSLQVAISSVRKLLETHQIGTVERNGARYQVVLSNGWETDLGSLRETLHSPTNEPQTIRSLQQRWAPVAQEFGAEDWLVELQHDLVSRLTEHTLRAIDQLIGQSQREDAVEMASAALKIDPYEHRLWDVSLPLFQGRERTEANSRYREIFGLEQTSA